MGVPHLRKITILIYKQIFPKKKKGRFKHIHHCFLSCIKLKIWSALSKLYLWASLVAQWWRIRLPMQGTRVQALVREDPTCCRATKLVRHNHWACAREPTNHNYWSLRATTTEARTPRACAPQQEKPLQWEARAPQWRVAPARRN